MDVVFREVSSYTLVTCSFLPSLPFLLFPPTWPFLFLAP